MVLKDSKTRALEAPIFNFNLLSEGWMLFTPAWKCSPWAAISITSGKKNAPNVKVISC
jgi:hypothetical protein